MKKASVGLRLTYSNLVTVTCLAHGLNLVAEEVRKCFPKVDSLISNVKKVFLKAPSRILKYKELFPTLALPPKPVLTRWGTWLEAADFYAKHYDSVKQVIGSFAVADAESIRVAQDLLQDPEIPGQLASISTNYASLGYSITKLENQKLSLAESIQTVIACESRIKLVKSEVGAKIGQKLEQTLLKNKGFGVLKRISGILNEDGGPLLNGLQLSPPQLMAFTYAPVTTCDVERSFSAYKRTLSDRRHNLTTEHLEWILVVQSYYNALNVESDTAIS
jgi:hypothetical protein